MDKKIVGASIVVIGAIGAAIATAVKKAKKQKNESSEQPNNGKQDTTDANQEIDIAKETYYRNQLISDEIQQAWDERDMLEAGYSREEIKKSMSNDYSENYVI